MDGTQPLCIVLGRSATALYIIRELGRTGIPICSEGMHSHTADWSKYLTHKPSKLGGITDGERVTNLLSLGATKRGDDTCLIASSDQDIAFLTRNANALSEKFHLQPSYANGLAEKLMDKEYLYHLCGQHDIPVPASWTKSRKQLRNLTDAINYPCLLKPSLIHEVKEFMAGKKMWIVNSAEEFKSIISKLPSGKTNWIAQEIISGPESEIWLYAAYFDKDSIPHQACTARKLRQFPPGFGSASLACTQENSNLVEICESFFKKISYQGIITAEFKKDPKDGNLKIIEVNPRASLWFGVTTAAQKLISLAAYNDATGREAPDDIQQQNGVYWRYLPKDIYSQIFYRWNKRFILPAPEPKNFPKSRKRVWAVFSYDDINPAIGELLFYFKKLVTRLTASATQR